MLLKKTVFVCVNYRDVFYNIFANNSILLSKRLMQRTFRSLCFKIRDMRTKKISKPEKLAINDEKP